MAKNDSTLGEITEGTVTSRVSIEWVRISSGREALRHPGLLAAGPLQKRQNGTGHSVASVLFFAGGRM